jgi:uncharacterized SAM-binding protein YcdF (DUF218 family)
MFGMNGNQEMTSTQDESSQKASPFKPSTILKWLVFLFIIIYFLALFFHVSLLTGLGRYLVIEHPSEKSDLIVCMGGGNIDRGLATADAYKEGLSSNIYISKEKLHDGYELLEEKSIKYPEEGDLLERLLLDLGVPGSAIIRSNLEADNSWDEARLIRDEVEKRGFKSIIIITSPTHSRRCWLTFRKVFEGTDVRVLSLPSKYSKFNVEAWWKDRSYLRDVLIEYEKLVYYILKYGI